MRPVSAILDRFRRGAGVPAAVGDELVSELATVFAALDVAEEDADRIRAEARRRGEGSLARARAEAARIEADGRRRADAERDRAQADRRRAVEEEVRTLVQAADEEASRIEALADERMPGLVDAVVACVEGVPR